MSKAKEEKKVSLKENVTAYFKGIRAEWGKISWPQKPWILSQTVVVFIVVTIFTVTVFLMDKIFKGALGLIPQ